MPVPAVGAFPDLIERADELHALRGLVARAAGGESGGVTFVEAAAGLGKTRLLEAAAELARCARVGVLHARGGELEKSFPFGIAAQLFAPAVAALDREQRDPVLSGAAELALEIVDPAAAAATAPASSEDALYARLHGLYWVCAGLAAQAPLVLIVDDAHWADEPSLQWLLFMARRIRDLPVTLVVSARPGEWPQPLTLLRSERDALALHPRPLTRPGTRTVIDRRLGTACEDAFAHACHEATGGNPFLLLELLAAVREDRLPATAASAERIRALAPEGVARSVLVRLGRLPAEAAALACCVAVLGGEAELRHAAALAKIDLERALAAADALTAAGLFEAARPLRLVHPVIRAALYGELPAGERARLHRRAASVLADDGAPPTSICAHLLESEPAGDPWTTGVLAPAADRALAGGAPGTAVRYLRRALAEPPPPAERALLLARLALAESAVGNPTAADHVDRAIALVSDPRERAQLALDQSVAYLAAGRFGDGIRVLEQAIEDCRERDEELRWRLVAQVISFASFVPAHAAVAAHHLDRIPRDLTGESPGARAVLAALAVARARSAAPVEHVLELARRADVVGRFLDEQPHGSLLLQNAIWALAMADRPDPAQRAFGLLIDRARRTGSPTVFTLMSSWRSVVHRLKGSLPEAIADAQAAVDTGMTFGASLIAPTVYCTLAMSLIDAGQINAAERAVASVGVSEQIATEIFWPLLAGRGSLRLERGDLAAGVADLLAAQAVLARIGLENPVGTHFRSTAALALARLGRDEEAQALAAEELAVARRFGAAGTVGAALRAVGVLERSSTGIDMLRESVRVLEASPARQQHAHALADLGAALRREGKRREAQQILREALDLADRCGARPIAERARGELLITGARPRRARLNGVEALTASERRVAELAAGGHSNREIAQALFVSQATVTTHLTHCYQKLGISSRGELAGMLGVP
jgi:DNA-binding CsgD family transcriptional regulator